VEGREERCHGWADIMAHQEGKHRKGTVWDTTWRGAHERVQHIVIGHDFLIQRFIVNYFQDLMDIKYDELAAELDTLYV
jgi:hypothetical protein